MLCTIKVSATSNFPCGDKKMANNKEGVYLQMSLFTRMLHSTLL